MQLSSMFANFASMLQVPARGFAMSTPRRLYSTGTVSGSKFSSIDYVGRARKSHALKKHVGVNWCPYEGYPAGTHKK